MNNNKEERSIANNATSYVHKAIDGLFMENPRITGFGVIFGYLFGRFLEVLNPLLEKKIDFIDLSKVETLDTIILGAFIFNLLVVIVSLFKKRKFSEEIEEVYEVIRRAKREGTLKEFQINQMYRNLYSKVLERVELNEKMVEHVQSLEKQINETAKKNVDEN